MQNSYQILTELQKDFPTVCKYYNNKINNSYLDELFDKLKNKRSELLPFEEMIRTVVEKDKDDLDYELLQKLETNLKILLPIKKAKGLKFDSVYNDLNDLSEDGGFWQKYNELNVFAWFAKFGEIEKLEWNKGNDEKKPSIDIKIKINRNNLYCEIMSLSQKKIRKDYSIIENEIREILVNKFGKNYSYRVDVLSSLKIVDEIKYINDFKKSLYSSYSDNSKLTYKEHIQHELSVESYFSAPYPNGTYNYDFWFRIGEKEFQTSIIPSPYWSHVFRNLENSIIKKLFDERNKKDSEHIEDGSKGKYSAFPEDELNILLLYVSRANEFMWYDNFVDRSSFSTDIKKFAETFKRIYIKNNDLANLNGIILMFPKHGNIDSNFIIFQNPYAKKIPFDIMEKLFNNNLGTYTITHKEEIYINHSGKLK